MNKFESEKRIIDMKDIILGKAKKAKEASVIMQKAGTNKKNEALLAIADALLENADYILNENKKDISNAKVNNVRETMIDRLVLTKERIEAMAEGVREVVKLKDPIGEFTGVTTRPNGLSIGQKRVPMGVVGIIYEARPNVTVDAASLTLKTGNACILRGGKEAINSNIALIKIMKTALIKCGLPDGAVEFIEDTTHESANEMMHLNGYIDVLIPRGSARLIQAVVNNSTVPIIETGSGNCHTYIHSDADIDMALSILKNAKVQRPSVCNACESLVVHKDIAKEFLPKAKKMLEECGVELRGCEKTLEIIDIKKATDEDFYTEYNDLIISVKIVDSSDEAISHINAHNTKHSECIVTKSYEEAQKFTNEIDAACVYVNASTRFTDGNEFGFGAEIGISTQKLHARGPMGLEALTCTKYIILGNGQIR